VVKLQPSHNNENTQREDFLREIMTEHEWSSLKEDATVYQEALNLYDEAYIESVQVFSIKDIRCIVPKSEIHKLPVEWKDTMEQIASVETLQNPIYLNVDENGILLVD
jgi:hypothetical protein